MRWSINTDPLVVFHAKGAFFVITSGKRPLTKQLHHNSEGVI